MRIVISMFKMSGTMKVEFCLFEFKKVTLALSSFFYIGYAKIVFL